MSSVLGDIPGNSSSILGPSYDYAAAIPTPASIGVSTDGSIDATTADIEAGMTYTKYLITGPNLGNKFFVNTATQCKDESGAVVDRYRYLDNSADQPKFASVLGSLGNFASGDLQGILPGIMVGLEDLNPLNIIKALARDVQPQCAKVSCPVGDVAGQMGNESQNVLAEDAADLVANYGCSNEFTNPQTPSDSSPHYTLLAIPIVCFLLIAAFKK